MKYICENCKKIFDYEDKALECERKHREEQARLEKLKTECEIRRKEVDEAYVNYKKLREKYIEDYGFYKPQSIVDVKPNNIIFPEIFSMI